MARTLLPRLFVEMHQCCAGSSRRTSVSLSRQISRFGLRTCAGPRVAARSSEIYSPRRLVPSPGPTNTFDQKLGRLIFSHSRADHNKAKPPAVGDRGRRCWTAQDGD
jgi:hypothetical protein